MTFAGVLVLDAAELPPTRNELQATSIAKEI
jgi:hypothetical protein